MKCKKSCIGLVILIILIAILLSLPYFFGKATETALRRVIKHIPAEPGVTINIKSYKRGWLDADAVIQVAIDTQVSMQSGWQYQLQHQGKIPPKLYFTVHEKIWHGPIIFAKDPKGKDKFFIARSYATGKLVIPQVEREQLKSITIDALDNANSILMKLSGDIEVNSTISQLHISSTDKTEQFSLQGFNVNYDLNANYHKQKGQVTLDNVHYQNQNNAFTIQHINHQFKLDRVLSHLWTGDSNLKIGLVNVTSQGESQINQQDIQLKSYATVKNKLLNLTIELNAGKLQYDHKQYGPAKINLKIMNIGADALNNLRDLDEKLQGNNLTRQQYFQAITHLTPGLFGHGAQVHLYPCQITTPKGDIKLNLNIAFPAIKGDKSMTTVKSLFQNVESHNEITVPKSIINYALTRYFQDKFAYIQQITGSKDKPALTQEQVNKLVDSKVQALLTNWEQEKYLAPQGDNYQVKILYQNKQLLVNNKVISQ